MQIKERKSSNKVRKAGPKSLLYRMVTIVLLVVNALLALGLIVSAYAGTVNPLNHSYASVAVITFPLWLIIMIIVMIISFFIRKVTALVGLLAVCSSLPAIIDYSPFHLPGDINDDDDNFTFLSYNVFGFADQHDEYPVEANRTISYILDADPDIACLQEVTYFSPNSALHITSAQIDSLHAQYPYIFRAGHGQAILSKFPVEPVQIDFKYNGSGSADIACFRTIIHGETVTIFNIHLQSFDLENQDREMYMKLTNLDGDKHEIRLMQHHLFGKICAAGRQRVLDTEELVKLLRKFGGPNVIICGDFNDVPGCYSLRLLEDQHMRQVYPEVGFGPMITYNAERFYFRIDHILYRGSLKPLSMSRGGIRTSDHYPVCATFKVVNE